jgi:hypothetical protein
MREFNITDTGTNAVQSLGIDADFNIRRFNDPMTPDQGDGKAPIVDARFLRVWQSTGPSRLYVNVHADGASTGKLGGRF